MEIGSMAKRVRVLGRMKPGASRWFRRSRWEMAV
jgi:hypothetical protein